MTIGYTRRVDLAGNTLKRLEYAVVRGSVRRRDPDGVVSAPYFDLGGTNRTLSLNIPGPSGFFDTIVFATQNATMQYVLDTINTAIGSAGTAYDLDGVVHIRSAVRGGVSYVAVLGGTAAAALGFSAFPGQPVESYGGDLPSAPEARRGNPPGTVFPSLGENLSTDSFVRALGRLAGNSDVLYSTLKRPMPVSFPLGTLQYENQTLLDASTGSVTWYDDLLLIAESSYLGETPTPERIATAFVLIDEVTEQPALSRIIDFRKGGSSVIGTKRVLGSFPITEIRDGKTIVAPSGTFGATREGQYVEITNDDSTANLVPWDHRGWWAVDQYVTDDINDFLTLRPLSPGERNSVGEVYPRPQAVTELNGSLEAGKTFGTVTLYEYPIIVGVDVVVSPPLPPGMSVMLWGPKYETLFDGPGAEAALHPAGRLLVAQDDSLPTALLTAPTVSTTGTSVNYTEFYVRRNGRKVRIPASAVSGNAIPSNGTVYILVWSTASGAVELRLASSLAGSDIPLGRILSPSPGVLTVAGSARNDRLYGLSSLTDRVVHVGVGQECPDIYTACNFVRSQRGNHGGWPNPGGATIVLHDQVTVITSTISLASIIGSPGSLRLCGATGFEAIEPLTPGMTLFTNTNFLWLDGLNINGTSYRIVDTPAARYRWTGPLFDTGTVYGDFEERGALGVVFRRETSAPGFDNFYTYAVSGGLRPLPTTYARRSQTPTETELTAYVGGVPQTTSMRLRQDTGIRLTDPYGTSSLTRSELHALVDGINADGLHTHKALEAEFSIDGVSTSVNVTAANLNTLTAGTSSNADSLHDHNASSLSADAYGSDLAAGTVQSQLREAIDSIRKKVAKAAAKTVKAFPATAGGTGALSVVVPMGTGTDQQDSLLFVSDDSSDPLYRLEFLRRGINYDPVKLASDSGVNLSGTPVAAARISDSEFLVATTAPNHGRIYKRSSAGVWSLVYDYAISGFTTIATNHVPGAAATVAVAASEDGIIHAVYSGTSAFTGWVTQAHGTFAITGSTPPAGTRFVDVAWDHISGWFVLVGGDPNGTQGWVARLMFDSLFFNLHRLAQGPSDEGTEYSAVAVSAGVFVAFTQSPSSISRSIDAGLTWSQVPLPPYSLTDPTSINFSAIGGAAGLADTGIFVALASTSPTWVAYVSVDGGQTWEATAMELAVTTDHSVEWGKPIYIERLGRWVACGVKYAGATPATSSWIAFSDPLF